MTTTLDQALDRGKHPDGIHRDRWQRPIVMQPGGTETTKCSLCGTHVYGKPYQRMTTFIDVLENTEGLTKWKTKMVAKGLALRSDLVLKAASQINDDKALMDVVDAAFEAAEGSAAATTGTAVHSFTEAVDRGEQVQIPPQVERDIAAYRQLLATERLIPREIECHVCIDGAATTATAGGVAGKFDRIFELDGVRYVGDVKTGKIDYGASKIAMQLAGYAMAKRYDPVTGERSDLDVDQDRAIVIHLPAGAGEATIHWADIAQGRDGLALAFQVWQWRQRSGLLSAAAPTGPDISGLIQIAGDRAGIEALWQRFNGAGWTDLHTRAAQRRIAELEYDARTNQTGAPA